MASPHRWSAVPNSATKVRDASCQPISTEIRADSAIPFDLSERRTSLDVRQRRRDPCDRVAEPTCGLAGAMMSTRERLLENIGSVYRFALRLAGDRHRAEDLTQETFLRAWRRRASLRDVDTARVWLFKIAANLWRDGLRRDGRRPRHAGPLADEVASCERSPLRVLEQREAVEQVLRQLDALPPRQRDVLFLHACEGLTQTQISEVLGIGADAVKASLSLARKRMRRQADDPASE